MKLFDRSNRDVRLTVVGAQYAARLQVAFDMVEQATRELHSEKRRERLKIGVFPSLASTWVMQKLEEYQALNPDLGLDIVCQTMFSDVDIHALDVMSMNTDLRQPNLDYLPLLSVVLTPICAPAVAEELQGDSTRLAQQVLLHSLRRPDHWGTWLRAAGLPTSQGKSARHFENTALAQQAAICGMGVAMGLTTLSDHLPSYGEMVQPFALRVPLEESYGFAWRPGGGSSSYVAPFIDWMRQERDARVGASAEPHTGVAA